MLSTKLRSSVRGMLRLPLVLAIMTAAMLCQSTPPSSDASSLDAQIQRIMDRPEFAHSSFGIEFYSIDSGKVIYQRNASKLMVPGSTTKLVTEGTALELFGGEHRFHTFVYRTGPVNKKGVLAGDLVLLGSGDLNLSGRMQADGTLAYENMDHSYGGPDSKGVGGDPLQAIKDLAQQIAAKGIRRVTGRVLVDTSLFPEGTRELGTGVVISPIVVNDNVIDVIASPGGSMGAPVNLEISPKTAYLQITNKAATGKADSLPTIDYAEDKTNADGTHAVTVSGSIPLGKPYGMMAYRVPEPSRFAAVVLAEAIRSNGIDISSEQKTPSPDFKALASNYRLENVVAEHVSPPLKEDVKITLKLSQNLHASTTPYLLGSLLAHTNKDVDQAGFDLENEFLKKAGLDLTAACQSDGAGGNAFFTADFMVQYLLFMSKQKDFQDFKRGLPIMGRDGTLYKIQVSSPAAGHVFAKTGTYAVGDSLNNNVMVTGKGLAGFMDTAKGDHLAFALYANMVSVPKDDPEAMQKVAGEALGEIATAAYSAPVEAHSAGTTNADYDFIIRNGRIFDGSGNAWISGDVAIQGERIAAIGHLDGATAKRTIDGSGLVISPGFIDMLGQSEMALLIDNRSLSKLSQGITTEITGEGASIAPQTEKTLASLAPQLSQYHLSVDWTDLDGYFTRLEKSGTPLNIGTYVGAAQIREAVIGDENRAPSPDELQKMKNLVAQTMQQGAFGISTALIYPPGHYAKTDELVELAKVAGEYGGLYATHMRSEGYSEVAAIDEALQIGREAHVPVEIFHLKVVGKSRWGSMPKIIAKLQAARDSGQDVSADMYPYVAGGTALASSLPPWIADGGQKKLLERLHDPATRARVKRELNIEHADWENLFLDSGRGTGVLVSGIQKPELKKYDGKTIAQIAAAEQKDPVDALMDLVIADEGQSGAIYFIAGETDLQYGLKQPWTSIGLDANEVSLDGLLFEPHNHPRAYGSMSRFLGHYVRDLHLLPLEQGIRKITSLPAQREHLRDRGLLKEGFFADVTLFDPAAIQDRATYANSTQLSEGVKYVFVNGKLEFENGKLTGIAAGKALRGPGWKQSAK